MTKIKVVNIDEIHNFVVDDFSFEILYGPKIFFEVLIFWNSNFFNCSMKSDVEMTKNKLGELDEIYTVIYGPKIMFEILIF
jgi:hypothetical protein